MQQNFLAPARALSSYTTELRRHFHMHPEPAMQEFETCAYICKELERMGISYEIIASTGVVATIQGDVDGKTVALRGDIDALEMDDKKDVAYCSKTPGLCHACGHDGHTAMLLTAAKLLQDVKATLHGTVKLIFQPGEESVSGARAMMEANDFLNNVESILGLHLMVTEPVGTIGYRSGVFASSADRFRIHVQGKGGHGAAPQATIDSLLVASAIVINAQSIISREIAPGDPGVLTFGMLHAGSRNNIISDEAILEGTMRAYDPKVRQTLQDAIVRMAKGIAESYRATAEITFLDQVCPLINDPIQTQHLKEVGMKLVGEENTVETLPMSASDDFAEFLCKVPGTYGFIGCQNADKGFVHFHHHPLFDIDEDALCIGSAVYAQYAYDFLNNTH